MHALCSIPTKRLRGETMTPERQIEQFSSHDVLNPRTTIQLRGMRYLWWVVIFVLAFVQSACAQTGAKVESAGQTKTKLELFQARTGVVIIRGFSKIGTIDGRYGNASVESKEFTDASSGKREYGITIEVVSTGDVKRDNTSYVDYDEIDSLLKGIDYISKIQSSVTKLSNFQADYRTKGELEISTFSSGGRTLAAVSSGSIGQVSAYFELSKLAELRDLIVKAKTNLGAIK
jgi:hypothetical protein